MSNYTTENLIPAIAGEGRVPAIKVGDLVFLMQESAESNSQSVRPYVLFVSNDQLYKGNYIATETAFNGVPVYELSQ